MGHEEAAAAHHMGAACSKELSTKARRRQVPQEINRASPDDAARELQNHWLVQNRQQFAHYCSQKWLERVSLESIVKPPYVGGSAVIYHIDGIDATKGTAATWPASSIIDA